MFNARFDDIEIDFIDFLCSTLGCNIPIPEPLIELDGREQEYKIFIYYEPDSIFYTLRGLLIHGLRDDIFTQEEIKSWFEYSKNEDKEVFENLIDGLPNV